MLFCLIVNQNKTKSLADVVRDRLKELSISQSDVSRRSKSGGFEGISQSTISMILSEKILLEQITLGNFISLARGLRMKPHRILCLVLEGDSPESEEKIKRIESFLEFLSADDLDLFLLFARAAAQERQVRPEISPPTTPRLPAGNEEQISEIPILRNMSVEDEDEESSKEFIKKKDGGKIPFYRETPPDEIEKIQNQEQIREEDENGF